jgi:anti-anti-sigma regulatory factor
MLRIDTDQDPSTNASEPLVLQLSGELVAETLFSFRPLVEGARAAGREVALDLDGVVRADRAGAEYLARLSEAGVRLRRCPLSLRGWLRIAGLTVKDEEEKPRSKPRRVLIPGCRGSRTKTPAPSRGGRERRRKDP